MKFLKTALATLALLVAVTPQAASAFTPESGLWWNPAEDGRGYSIEIQDNVLVVLVYGFDNDANRSSAFFLGAGAMQGNSSWSGSLDGYTGGQCLTCNYQGRPLVLTGAGGTASIVFDTESRGRLTIGSRVIPIERFNYALGNATEQMLGEWQVVLDFAPQPFTGGPLNISPFYGEIFTIDRVDTSFNPDQYRGCRPSTSSAGRCVALDNANHDLAGFFDAAANKQVVVVTDRVDGSDRYSLVYYLTAGLSQFDGVVEVRRNNIPSAARYPVRGFRSASKRFVQTGTGPSSSGPSSDGPTPKATAASVVRPGIIESLGGIDKLPAGLSADTVKSRYGIDVEALEPKVHALIESMR